MPRPADQDSDKALWEAATRLLEQHGELLVGDFILNQFQATLDEGDHIGTSQWLRVTNMITELLGPGDDTFLE